jgi:PKD repeat protein
MRALLAALALLVLGCVTAPAALAAPAFTWAPVSPLACEQVTFTPSPDAESPRWDYGTGTFVTDPTHTFTTEGTHAVTLDAMNGPRVTHDVIVQNAPPVASFNYSPAQPNPDEWIVFTSTSTDCGDSLTYKWDLDADGLTDSTAASPTYKFSTPGPHVVSLEVSDGDVADTEVHTVDVRDPSAPIAAFHRDPGESVVLQTGQQATFTSDSAASPGSSLGWQIDGVSVAGGQSLTYAFSDAGWHVVRLTVTQPNGKSDDEVSIFQVAGPALIAPAATQSPATTPATPTLPALMKPFPTVRLAGLIVPRGVRKALVEVRGAPRGARVTVRCTGTGCPFRSRRRVAETGTVRLPEFKRVLRSGARLEVLVRAPNVIGRYVRWRIRGGKPPVRTDRCLMPGASSPTPCT